MVYPAIQPIQLSGQSDDLEQLLISDFKGGLNITDPVITMPPNQFTAFLNFFHNRQGTIEARPPFRPEAFKSSAQDKPIIVDYDYAGDMYQIKTLLNYQVFRESLSNGWSYNSEVHVITGVFEDITGGGDDFMLVVVYNSSDEKWTKIWAEATTGLVSAVSVCPYKINKAFDLLIFPDVGNPERWVPSSATSGGDIVGVVSDLGLTPPTAADSFTATGVVSDSAEGMDRIAAGVAYYKFSFFYDDSNTSTKYGESATTVVTDGNCDEGVAITVDATKKGKVTITFSTVTVPANVSKVRIYRAPDSTPEGPYEYIGEAEVTSTTVITEFVDTTPWDAEGVEDLVPGTNPSLSGSDLATLNVQTIGAYLVGFDASMPHKLIWSNAGYPDVWNPLNFDYLGNTGKAVIEFNRKIYVFTTDGCYQKDTMDSTAVKISNIGCIDGRTLQDVGNGLIWMDYDTIYFADFVQQYGSKGDFPADIGHNISKSILRRSDSYQVSSVFFERRYYVTYVDTEDFLSRTYVFDVDWKDWQEHSAKHLMWDRGDRTLHSVGAVTVTANITVIDGTIDGGNNALITSVAHGLSTGDYVTISGTTNYNGTYVITYASVDTFKIVDASQNAGETGAFTITKHYVYEHDYSASVIVASGFSTYAGRDFHDYNRVAQTTLHGISNITVSIGRQNARIAGDFRKIFVSSLTVEAQGSIISILATIASEGSSFSVSKTLSSGSDAEGITQYAFIFDESVFAAGAAETGDPADSDEAGFAGFSSTTAAMHAKIKRVMKSRAIGVTLTAADSRGLSILYLVLYWKPLSAVA